MTKRPFHAAFAFLPLLAVACVAPRNPPPPVAARPAPASPAPVRAEPAPPPPFQAAAVMPDAASTSASTYIVRRGDTLRGIAAKTGAGSEAIARANGLAPPFLIRIGQRLAIPAGRWHLVRAGQTGIAIARAYGLDWSEVATLNQLAEPYILRTGQRLQLPSAQATAAMSLEERARAFQLDIDDIITGGEPAIAERAQPVKPSPGKPASVPPTQAVAASGRFDGRFIWPAEGRILTGFGSFGSGRRNDGINIAVAEGAEIVASADGVVLYAGTEIAALGGLILIRHSDSWTTAYGHARELMVKRGDAVKRGQVIARAGETGYVAEPQVHFEIREGRKAVNPLQYLAKRG
jgi:lipoprotein NlpD